MSVGDQSLAQSSSITSSFESQCVKQIAHAHQTSDSLRSKTPLTRMSVGVNCLQVDPSYVGGVTTYILGLLEGFANIDSGCQFRLFVTEDNKGLFSGYSGRANFDVITVNDKLLSLKSKICRAALLSHSGGFFRVVSDLAFKDIQRRFDSESDVVYTPTPVLRYFNSQKPTVLTMHDIQHYHYPEFFGRLRLLSRRITYDLSARYACYLHANSRYTKEDFLRQFTWIPEDRIEIIPPGVSVARFGTPADTEFLRGKYEIPDRFLFYPAQLWPHKNHITVLKALKKIEKENGLKIPLVLTGAKYSAADQIEGFVKDQGMDYVRYLGAIPTEDIVPIYQKATFLIMATLHESGGFPILESAAAGTPIIASRIPPFEEFGEQLQLNFFEPLDANELASLILSLWGNEKMAAAQTAYNREHIALYSWESAAQKYVELFRRAID